MAELCLWRRRMMLPVIACFACVEVVSAAEPWVAITGNTVTVEVSTDLSLAVNGQDDERLWKTSETSTPAVTLQRPEAEATELIRLGAAERCTVEPFADKTHRGRRLRLGGLPGFDVEVELVLALSASDELLVEVEQVGGTDTVCRVADLYTWDVEPAADGHLVVPRGSGYIIRCDSGEPVHLPPDFIGSAYSLPLFGIVQGGNSLYQIVDTWWDTTVEVIHTPGDKTRLVLDWESSLGRLRYPRRQRIVFGKDLDHVDMAKAYRKELIDKGQLITLEQRLKTTPLLKRFLKGVEYRVIGWDDQEHRQILDNIVRFQDAGLPITFFHPKWPQTPGWVVNAWQDFLKDAPCEGGWNAAGRLVADVHRLGCPVKLFVIPYKYYADGPGYDEDKTSGVGFPQISDHFAAEIADKILGNLEHHGIQIEALYYDGHSAYDMHQEHRSPEGPVSRRQTYEAQNACFQRTRAHGVVPGAELARFWCMGHCDFFFFTDWARDRLRHGEPIPLFQLVFNDCYAAHFSGGGYYDEGKYDWYADRHPRLYELMYAAMPSHNWLPGGSQPIEPEDWHTRAMERRLEWLRLWHAYFQKVCYAEMLTHEALNPERTRQRVEFAGGVVAEFDLERGRYRVDGVPGFTGDWEERPQITRTYNN